jgi:hypothetical protein
MIWKISLQKHFKFSLSYQIKYGLIWMQMDIDSTSWKIEVIKTSTFREKALRWEVSILQDSCYLLSDEGLSLETTNSLNSFPSAFLCCFSTTFTGTDI